MPQKIIENGIALTKLAQKVQGEVLGDSEVLIKGLCSLEEPQPACLAFAYSERVSDIKDILNSSSVAALLVNKKIEVLNNTEISLVLVADPIRAMIDLIPEFYSPHLSTPGLSPQADISASAKIGDNVSIGAFSSIGHEVEIADNVIIHPHVVIYPGAKIGQGSVIHSGAVIREDCVIGPNVIIQNGAVIGADGFGYVPDEKLGLVPVPQVGRTIIEERVEIGANSCVDRATLGTTKIEQGAKLDNLVQVGHNTKIGKYSILCGQVGISGSCRIGNQVTLGGMAGVANQIKISDGCRVAAKSGVTKDLEEAKDYGGYPAVAAMEWRRQIAAITNLPKIMKQLKLVRNDKKD